MATTIGAGGRVDLGEHGIDASGRVHLHPSTSLLYTHTLRRDEGRLAEGGPLVVDTGRHTGRSPNDKFVVREPDSENRIWWSTVNQEIDEEHFEGLRDKVASFLEGQELYVVDSFAGADPAHRLGVRVITHSPWHALFAKTLFIEPADDELTDFEPDALILHAPAVDADPEEDSTRSSTFVVLHPSRSEILIGGTFYAGEIKKSVFTLMNDRLPLEGVLPMHSSANVGEGGDVAVFFGLSGTGKTTLSADPERRLIGDDEHGWSDTAIFNFEGGCYAKMIRLSPEAEPEIYATTKRFGTVLENVVIDPETRELDLDSSEYAENSRGAYPIHYIPNCSEKNMGPVPKNIVMLTADAFGVLPPIAKLTPDQAMYHFLSGYTAKVAGTEIGVTEPEATFSTCFGAPFMPRHPSVYGNLLKKRIAEGSVDCWLVNTGWTGGKYGIGKRMPIKETRALLNAALDGSLKNVEFRRDANFGFEVPVAVPGVDSSILDPRSTWADKAEYDRTAATLVDLFIENFAQFADQVDEGVRQAAPKVPAAA